MPESPFPARGPASRRKENEAVFRARILSTPKHYAVKGLFVESVLALVDKTGGKRPTTRRYIPFKDYPLREFMELMLDCTYVIYPGETPADGLRKLGALGFRSFSQSLAGRVLFSFAGRDWKAILQSAPKAYQLSLTPGRARLARISENDALIELRDVRNFGDTYQVGIFEGAMEDYGVVGEVRAVPLNLGDTDIHCRWR